jgi:hypothetical protein
VNAGRHSITDYGCASRTGDPKMNHAFAILLSFTSLIAKARLTELTVTPLLFTPAEFGAYMAAETEKWTKMIKVAGIKAE